MEKTWQDLKPQLVTELVDTFTEAEFAQMLDFKCGRKLSDLVARDIAFPQKVYETVDHAERHGWLDCLAKGAQESNLSHGKLQRVTAAVLAGIEAGGAHFYQQHIVDEDAGIEDERVLLRRLENYLKTLQLRTSAVPLASLDESGEIGKKLALERVFIGLNAGQYEVELDEDGLGKEKATAAVGHLHDRPRLILLGEPGSGKSTLLRYVAYCLAGAARRPDDDVWREQLAWPVYDDEGKIIETRQWTAEAPVPVFVVLRDFARRQFDAQDGTAIMDFVCEQLQEDGLGEAADPLRRLTLRGRVLFLLDGVDEVPEGERAAVWEAIGEMDKGAYGGNRWAATCRVLSFNKDEAPSGEPVETLQPLNEAQIVEFIDNWYAELVGQLGRDVALDKAKTLKGEVQQRPTLRELAQNPMLLTIMALVQTFRTLPNERAKLYQACVETLLLRWQMPKEGAEEGGTLPDMLAALGVNQQKLERLLWEVAWQAHREAITRQERADIKESEIMALAAKRLGGYGKAEQFLAYTEQRAHLLVGRGGLGERVFSFPHRTFQEYLAACYLTPGMRLLKEAPVLAEEGDIWREVLNLAAGVLVYNNNNFELVLFAVERMVPHSIPAAKESAVWYRIWLAGEMAAVVGRQNFEESDFANELLPLLKEQFVALLQNEALTPQQRAEAGDALGQLGDPRPGVCTLEPDLIEIPAGDFLSGDEIETHSIERPFAIARYPVTVAQFAMFVEDGGYEKTRYWVGKESAGWSWRQSEHPNYRGEGSVTEPRYWRHTRWHEENRPVVGVSWYEAQAYCAWLTEKSGREYRLPAAVEWERAARSTDGREYAWGNEWEDGIINSREVQINRTTAVGAFPRGAAECGADDMGGNVLEWMAYFSYSDPNSSLVRGGSWLYPREYARVVFLGNNKRDLSYFNVGFRLVSPVS